MTLPRGRHGRERDVKGLVLIAVASSAHQDELVKRLKDGAAEAKLRKQYGYGIIDQ